MYRTTFNKYPWHTHANIRHHFIFIRASPIGQFFGSNTDKTRALETASKDILERGRELLNSGDKEAIAEGDVLLHRGEVTIDTGRHRVTVAGEPVVMTALEMRILVALARRPGLVLTRYQIVDLTQGEGVGVTDRSVDVHIVSLRRKLGAQGALIETVRGVGYRFSEEA